MNGSLIINLGTPDGPGIPAVRRYLRQFLSDPDVMDISPLLRFVLLNLIILPFRSPTSAHAYRKIWDKRGSPLRYHTESLAEKLHPLLGPPIEWAMRYGNPAVRPALESLRTQGVTRLTLLPLYPQFAQSSVTSTLSHVEQELSKMEWHPKIRVIPPFYRDKGFIAAAAEKIRPLMASDKHLLMSFHGIPERHILRSSPVCKDCLATPSCETLLHPLCYRGQCYETARSLAKELGLKGEGYSVSFQSRLGRTPWIRPYTDLEFEPLVTRGIKKLVVACPSFVADCLETLEEIGMRGKESFLAAGGKSLELAPCPNDSDAWVNAMLQLLKSQTPA